MRYLDFLKSLHERLAPEAYLEIGVKRGSSLGLSRCRSVGIDPAFAVSKELHTEVHLFRTTSDEYFSRPEPLAPTGGVPFDLAFIDGMHLFEFALRDFIHAERHSRPSSLVVFDDILPRTPLEAARDRRTRRWTGDVYPIMPVLERYRPEITMIAVDTEPTGLLLVMGLDPDSTVLADSYDAIVREFRRPDPQPVPQELLERTLVQQPERLLSAGFLDLLVEARRGGRSEVLAPRLREAVAAALGPAYAVT